jgi:hypothetical protein
MTTADWQKAYRGRRKAGMACFEIELPEVELVQALQDADWLPMDDPQHDDIVRALQNVIQRWIEDELQNEKSP